MASISRVELHTDAPDLQDSLQARLHDPLWLLARQWQFGEFKGEDTGSPAAAQVVIETAPISRYQPGPASSAAGAQPYSPLAIALETVVEREPVVKGATPNWRWATQAGLQLMRPIARGSIVTIATRPRSPNICEAAQAASAPACPPPITSTSK